MRFPGWFEDYIQERPQVVQAPTVLQVDSLFQRAMFRNPLMSRTLHVLLYDQLPGRWGYDRYTVALLAYGAGKYDKATAGFGSLIREDPATRYRMRYALALCFTAAQQYDSAATELLALLEEMRRRDEKHLAYFYESKELLEYSVALLRMATGDRAAARAALQRALVENVAFYPAHAMLGEVALRQGDRPGAWREFDQAVELAADDGVLRYRYGSALALAGRYAEAEPQLRKATELEPWFALPYYMLGTVLEKRGAGRQALEQYRAFALRAARSAPELDQALARIEGLSASAGDSARRP
jgi:predicted Zn-dependent protease